MQPRRERTYEVEPDNGPDFCMYCNSNDYVLRKADKFIEKKIEDTTGDDGTGNTVRYRYVDERGDQAYDSELHQISKPVCNDCWRKIDSTSIDWFWGFLLWIAVGVGLLVLSYRLFPEALWEKAEGMRLVGDISLKGFLVRAAIYIIPTFKLVGIVNRLKQGKQWLKDYENNGTEEYRNFLDENDLNYFNEYKLNTQVKYL